MNYSTERPHRNQVALNQRKTGFRYSEIISAYLKDRTMVYINPHNRTWQGHFLQNIIFG